MLSLTRKTDYALVALADLARRAPERASARQISESCQVPLPMLMNILKNLMNCGLVNSTRGVNGGYCLAGDPQNITLADLIRAVEGPVRLTVCCTEATDPTEPECSLQDGCLIKEPIQKVHDLFRQFLGQVTLAHILSNAVPVSLRLPVAFAPSVPAPAVAVL